MLPCRDEAAALLDLLPKVPAGFAVVVVDNGSRDDTAEVARRWGATVVHEPVPGYGAAVHAGLLAATSEYVAFMDGDGSFDAGDLPALLDDVRSGRADLAVGRRRPVARGVWPWHARLGNNLVVWWLRRRIGMAAHDIAPMRVCRRDGAARARRAGPPVRLPGRAAPEGHAGRVAALRARRRLPPARRSAPGRRCPARCGARRGRPATSGGCSRDAVGAGRRQGTRGGPGEDPARRRDRHGARRRGRCRGAARHAGRRDRGRRRRALPPLAGRRPRARRPRTPSSGRPWPAGASTLSAAPTSAPGWPMPTRGCRARSSRSAWTPRT